MWCPQMQRSDAYDGSLGSDSCWTCRDRYLRLHARETTGITLLFRSENTGDTHTQEVALQARPTRIRDNGHAILGGDLHDFHHVLRRVRVHDHAMCEACVSQTPVQVRVRRLERDNGATTRLRASHWAKSRACRGSGGLSRQCLPQKTPRAL